MSGNIYDSYVNVEACEGVVCRPVVAAMAEAMEAEFAKYDGVKTMDGETVINSTYRLDLQMAKLHHFLAVGDYGKVAEISIQVANRAALTRLLCVIEDEGETDV